MRVAGSLDAVVVTGFLGAGKTTFILHALLPWLMTEAEPVLLVNDAGEVNFDAERLAGAGVPLVSVAGGCGCCELAGVMADAVAHLAAQSRRPLVIEGSGLAAPQPLLQALRAHGLHRIAVLGLVHGPTAQRRLAEPLAQAQLAAADWLFISAADTLSGRQASELAQTLDRLRPRPVSFWSLAGGVADPRWPAALPALLGEGGPEAASIGPAATPEVARRTLRPRGWATRAQWEAWLQDLPTDLWRVKGCVAVTGAVWPQALDHNGGDAPSWHAPAEPVDPYLVVIGAPRSLLQLPPLPEGTAVDLEDDAAWWPGAAADGRGQAGWSGGTPLSLREAGMRWLDAVAHPSPADLIWLAPGWDMERGAEPVPPPQARLEWDRLGERLQRWQRTHPTGRWLVGGWPLAHVQQLAARAGLPAQRVWHAGRHWVWPDAGLSCRLPQPLGAAGRSSDLRQVKPAAAVPIDAAA